MQYSDLCAGQTIKGFEGFGCIPKNAKRTVLKCNDGFYVCCREGKHFLDGQCDEEDRLVGLSLAKDAP